MYDKILVAVDNSKLSDRAVVAARDLAVPIWSIAWRDAHIELRRNYRWISHVRQDLGGRGQFKAVGPGGGRGPRSGRSDLVYSVARCSYRIEKKLSMDKPCTTRSWWPWTIQSCRTGRWSRPAIWPFSDRKS